MDTDSVSRGANRTGFFRPRHVAGLELVSAFYDQQCFPAHAHDEFVIGAITAGAERLSVGRRSAILTVGDTLFLHPGEMHANAVIGDAPLKYRVFYIAEELIRETLRIEDASLDIPSFAMPFSRSPEHHDLIVQSHCALLAADDALSQQSGFVCLAMELAKAFRNRPEGGAEAENAKVTVARDYIRALFRTNPSLSDVSEVAGLSPFYLLRAFKRQVGLSPVAYRNLLRVMAAKDALSSGEPLAAAALNAGFADQSHMTRDFKKIMGATPGRYARQ